MTKYFKNRNKKATLTSRFFYCSKTQIIELVDQVEQLQYGYQ